MAWHLGVEQAAALLVHRCRIIAYEDDIDEIALRAGGPQACLPILRYLFTGFSEALADVCEAAGCSFSIEMTDAALIDGIIRVWPTISPNEPSLGAVTVAKMLQPNEWGVSRLLFTLQCVLVCCRAHDAAVKRQDAEWLASVEWTNTSPQQQFEDRRVHVGSESQNMRSAVAWMAEAYREQLDSVGEQLGTVDALGTLLPAPLAELPEVGGHACSTPLASDTVQIHNTAVDNEQPAPFDAGAAEQAAWLEKLRNRDAGIASTFADSTHSPSSSLSTIVPMLTTHPAEALNAGQAEPQKNPLFAEADASDARVAYSVQCERAGLSLLATQAATIGLKEPPSEADANDAEVAAITYRGALARTCFPAEPASTT